MSYSSNILNSGSGIIEIRVPQHDSEYKAVVKGILQDDIQIQMGNNWSPFSELNPSVMEKLQGLQQIWQADSVTNYIPTSGMAWKGTEHIRIQTSFYLVNFNPSIDIQKSAKTLAELCALKPDGSTATGFHGGYKMDLYHDNGSLNNKMDYKQVDIKGTCEIRVNSQHHTCIKGLLAKDIQLQPSTVSVWNHRRGCGEPLYYIVNMSFTGHRAPIMSDLKWMFGGR